MSAIKEISGSIVKDSRNENTIEGHILLDSGAAGVASAPSGKSKGIHEAATVSPEKADELLNGEIAESLRGKSFETQRDFDSKLVGLDGTENKARLGGNTTTALSAAFAKASAAEARVPLYQYISDSLGDVPRLPAARSAAQAGGNLRLFANMVGGGLHAENNLRFQEHWIIPEAVSLANQIEMTKRFFEELGRELKRRFPGEIISSSDEGSYSLRFPNESAPFATMNEVRDALCLSGCLDFGMDAAASGVKGEPAELAGVYKEWRRRFGLIAIEDPFGEEDFTDFHKLRDAMPGVAIIGDDLTTTNTGRMKKAHEIGSVNSVIIKPNQIGTLTEALNAVRLAREYGWQVIVSHRSGETMDSWIADFAVGAGADGFKLGAPSRTERLAKYKRLIAIEKESTRPSS